MPGMGCRNASLARCLLSTMVEVSVGANALIVSALSQTALKAPASCPALSSNLSAPPSSATSCAQVLYRACLR